MLFIYGRMTLHPESLIKVSESSIEDIRKYSFSKKADYASDDDDDSVTLNDWNSWFKDGTDSDSLYE